MAFPLVVSSATDPNNSGTSIPVAMPGSLVAGNLLLLTAIVTGSGGSSISGWTLVGTQANSSGASIVSVWAKEVVGGDTATIVPAGGVSQSAAIITRQISGWSHTLSDITMSGNNSSLTTAPNTPSHTGLYNRDNLWFSGTAGNNFPAMTAPSGYTGTLTAGIGSNAAILAQAYREESVQTEDPGAWTGTLAGWTGVTVVVPPAVSVLLPRLCRQRFRHLLVR